ADDAVQEPAARVSRIARRGLGQKLRPEILQTLRCDIAQHPQQYTDGDGHQGDQHAGHGQVGGAAAAKMRGGGQSRGGVSRGADRDIGTHHAISSPARRTISLPITLTTRASTSRTPATTNSDWRWNGSFDSVNSL